MSCDYILFSHLYEKPLLELLDADARRVRELVQLLEEAHHPGMAVLFYHAGWKELVRGALLGIADEHSIAPARQASLLAHQIEAVARQISAHDESPVRIITALDLLPLIEQIASDNPAIPAEKLANFLGTNFTGSRYDLPKLVESFLRLRSPSEIPILRIDQDVLFNDVAYPDSGLCAPRGLAAPIQQMLEYCHHFRTQQAPHSHLVSGQYLSSTAARRTATWTPTEWLSTFATRPFPALIVTEAGDLQFEEETLRSYYGLDPSGTQIEITDDGSPKGIARLGAPPLNSPISGALMTLSSSLVAATPPFCNFRTNVVWIDDYLNFALHRELSQSAGDDAHPHFANPPTYAACKVAKARPVVDDAREYTLTNYLPALVRGCIVDAWIQPDARIKLDRLRTAPPGPLIRHLHAAQQSGSLSSKAAQQCREELRQSAWLRLEDVRKQWSGLPHPTSQSTLASEWLALDDLASLVELEVLLDDTLEYIEWAVAWPQVVTTVYTSHRAQLRIDVPTRRVP